MTIKHSIFLLLCLFLANIVWSQEERIKNFDVFIEIDSTGELTITENILVYANGTNIRRGIFRELPLRRKDINHQWVPIAYELLEVKKDGMNTTYHTEESSKYFTVYIGDRNEYLDPDDYTYTIKYKTWGQLGFFENYDEIYWNVTGNDWKFNIDRVQVMVDLPGNPQVIQKSCYTGFYGSTASNCVYSDNLFPTYNAVNLLPKEGLTIAIGFEKGFVNYPPLPTYWEKNKLWIISLACIGIMLIYYLLTWSMYGRDPEKPAAYPIFDPPNNISPAYLGSVNSDKIRYDLISASLINMATKGYIEIKEVEKGGFFRGSKYRIIKRKSDHYNLPQEERALLISLFSGADQIDLDGEYNSRVRLSRDSYEKSLDKQLNDFINTGRNYHFLIPPIILSILAGIYMIFNTQFLEFLGNYEGEIIVMGSMFLIFSGIIYSLLRKLFRKNKWSIILLLIALGLLIFYLGTFKFSVVTYLVFTFVLFAISSIISYKYLINQPTTEKLELQSQIEGFKMYMEAAENEQIKQFNPPSMTPEIFEKLLPYAIALKVDRVWGQKFEQYLASANISNYQSNWYNGSSSFRYDFPRTLSKSVNESVNTTSTKPSESGGSYGSGSGGGGFSGGGGGGGGGGGW